MNDWKLVILSYWGQSDIAHSVDLYLESILLFSLKLIFQKSQGVNQS
jgi:hypothetical protein